MYRGHLLDMPTFAYFDFGNTFMGSALDNRFNFHIIPKSKDEPPVLHTLVWYGGKCSDLSEIEKEFDEPLTDEGYQSTLSRLDDEIKQYHEKLVGEWAGK